MAIKGALAEALALFRRRAADGFSRIRGGDAGLDEPVPLGYEAAAGATARPAAGSVADGLTMIERLIRQLILHEGMKLKPYLDSVQKLTIGVGRNLDDVGITEDEARMLLKNDIMRVFDDLDTAFPWWRDMNEARQLVLADMCFNMGLGTLRQFKNTLAAMERGDYDTAAHGMLSSKWARQVKGRAMRLVRMMRTGEIE